jgi:hypothetical protein
VVVGATLALPVFYFTSLAMLVGVLPFAREALGREMRVRGWWPTGGVESDATQAASEGTDPA